MENKKKNTDKNYKEEKKSTDKNYKEKKKSTDKNYKEKKKSTDKNYKEEIKKTSNKNTRNKKKKKKESKHTKYQILVAGIVVFIVVVVTLGGSYAVFSDATESNEYNVINVGNFELSYVDLSEKGNVLTINNPYPVSDEIGGKGASYRFSVENTGNIKANYKIVVTDDLDVIEADKCKDKLVNKNNVRYKFNLESPKTLQEVYNEEEKGYIMYTSLQPLNPGDSEIHEIRMWLNENSGNDILGKHYHGKVNVVLIQAEGLE